jgi:hypothetical protein
VRREAVARAARTLNWSMKEYGYCLGFLESNCDSELECLQRTRHQMLWQDMCQASCNDVGNYEEALVPAARQGSTQRQSLQLCPKIRLWPNWYQGWERLNKDGLPKKGECVIIGGRCWRDKQMFGVGNRFQDWKLK